MVVEVGVCDLPITGPSVCPVVEHSLHSVQGVVLHGQWVWAAVGSGRAYAEVRTGR